MYALDTGGGLKIIHGEGGGDQWKEIYMLVEGMRGGQGEIEWERDFDPQKPDIKCTHLISVGAWK